MFVKLFRHSHEGHRYSSVYYAKQIGVDNQVTTELKDDRMENSVNGSRYWQILR